MNSLLIIDDDIELCTLLTERLAEEGFASCMPHTMGEMAWSAPSAVAIPS